MYENYRFSTNHQLHMDTLSYARRNCLFYNKQKNTWMLGNTRLFLELNMIITRLPVGLACNKISCSTLEIDLVGLFPSIYVYVFSYILYVNNFMMRYVTFFFNSARRGGIEC